jgi:two-component system OmpR family sensor kinase
MSPSTGRVSLRTRLIAVVVAVTLFALTAGGTATWFALRHFLVQRLDGQLYAQAGGLQRGVQDSLDDGQRPVELAFDRRGPGGDQDLRALCVDSDGTAIPIYVKYLAGDALFPTLQPSQHDVTTMLNTDGAISLTTVDGKDVRAAAIALHGGQYLFVGTSLDAVNDILGQLLALQLAIGGGAVLVAIGLGAWGVRAGMGPLTKVTATANEIAQNLHTRGSGLERRVPDGNPSTEVGKLSDALNTLLGAAQAAYTVRVENEERMRHFLADASHELRTPLTSLRGYAELERLRSSAGAEDPAATKDALRRIEAEGDRMAKLVDDLLLLARADAQGDTDGPEEPVSLGPVPVEELLGEAVDRARVAHPGREFRIDADGTGLLVHADYETLLQVLGNLLRNAAIHTPGPRPIRAAARLDRSGSRADGSGRGVVLTIADEGPGMSSEQAAHAFDRFWRADSGRTRATGGSGLGLPIVAALVEAQHGEVSLASAQDSGTTVTVRLPLEEEAVVTPVVKVSR